MKNRSLYKILPFILVGVSIVLCQDISSLLSSADQKQKENDFEGNYALLQDAERLEPENLEVIWRLARAHFDFSDNTNDEAVISEHIYAGFEYARRALEKDNNSAKAHKWYGILIGRVGEIEGTEQKIKNSYKVSEHTLKAIDLDPEDDGNYHVMGRWHFTLADLNWFERTIAKFVYATPPEATFEEARDYFQKAIDKAPDEIRHHLWLGKTLVELGEKSGAKTVLNKALTLNAKSDSDRLLQQEAREVLDDL